MSTQLIVILVFVYVVCVCVYIQDAGRVCSLLVRSKVTSVQQLFVQHLRRYLYMSETDIDRAGQCRRPVASVHACTYVYMHECTLLATEKPCTMSRVFLVCLTHNGGLLSHCGRYVSTSTPLCVSVVGTEWNRPTRHL